MSGILVAGAGSASAQPDVATLALSATCLRPTAGAAVAAADACVRRVADAVSAEPAAAGPVTTGMSVHLEHDHTVSPPRQTGVRANHRLRVDVRDIDRLGDVLAAVLTAGGEDLGLDDVTVGVADEQSLDRRARDAAFADARARAEQLAALAGRAVGEVLEVEETDGGGPRPLAKQAMAMESLMIAPSTVVRTVQLTVRWALA